MTRFKVMTWNVENLFAPGKVAKPEVLAQYRRKLTSLSNIILHLKPDVLALQEVGSQAALAELVSLLQGKYPHTIVSTYPDPRGIRVGFISKLPIESVEEITEFAGMGLPSVPCIDSKGNLSTTSSLGRGALRITVRPKPAFPVNLITAHLKSKLLTYPSKNNAPRFIPLNENERARMGGLALLKRTAEAVTLRAKANELLEAEAGAALIVLGDLNDVPEAATNQILQGPNGSEIGTDGFKHSDRADRVRLFNLAPCLPKRRRFSRIQNKTPELIDHILVSEKLLPGKPRRLPRVNIFLVKDGLPSVTNDPADRAGHPASDHAPLFATFEVT